ncbi:MAG: phosphotransferase [Acidimicrobiales bacterium]|nr:phosphotransferase [Acidimicrobiales bacterium]
MIDLQPDLDLSMAQAEAILEAWLGEPVRCSQTWPLEGAMVNTVLLLEFDRPPYSAVVKLHGGFDPFALEAKALRFLGSETECPVPAVYLYDDSRQFVPFAFLLLEQVPGVCLKKLELEPLVRADIDAQLAQVLAELHGHTRESFGAVDEPLEARSWSTIFGSRLTEWRAHPEVDRRLAPMVLSTVDAAIGAIPELLRDAGTPTLVHGDVWDGNLMVQRQDTGRYLLSGLLDPAVQFADVELELAYLQVFNNANEAFFSAYNEQRELRPGYEQRRLAYWLHTALVHVALFGDEFFCNFTSQTAEALAESA